MLWKDTQTKPCHKTPSLPLWGHACKCGHGVFYTYASNSPLLCNKLLNSWIYLYLITLLANSLVIFNYLSYTYHQYWAELGPPKSLQQKLLTPLLKDVFRDRTWRGEDENKHWYCWRVFPMMIKFKDAKEHKSRMYTQGQPRDRPCKLRRGTSEETGNVVPLIWDFQSKKLWD